MLRARHHQHITLAEEIEHCSQLFPPRGGRAGALLGSDDLATGRLQCRLLNGEVLIDGADASAPPVRAVMAFLVACFA
jgi:hypothetical protein